MIFIVGESIQNWVKLYNWFVWGMIVRLRLR